MTEKMAEQRTITIKSSRTDLVTDLDKAVQDFLMEKIHLAYPQDIFLAEESQDQATIEQGQVWVIDPIDGTVNFIAQQADFAIMLAYFEQGQGQFGLIYDVLANKLYAGGGAFPVTCNGIELQVPAHRPLEQSLVAANTGLYLSNADGLRDYFDQSLGIRNYGCAGLSMMRVLTGQLYAYASNLYPWDYLPAMIMGEKLGVSLRTLNGEELTRDKRQKVIFLPETDDIF